MSNKDSVSDFTTRIRNAVLVKSSKVIVEKTNLILDVCKILYEEGFIDSFEVKTGHNVFFSNIVISLKYKGIKQKSYITGIKRVSKPGSRVYVNCKEVPKVLGGIGTAILTTSKGVLTDRSAKLKNLGGEILFVIW